MVSGYKWACVFRTDAPKTMPYSAVTCLFTCGQITVTSCPIGRMSLVRKISHLGITCVGITQRQLSGHEQKQTHDTKRSKSWRYLRQVDVFQVCSGHAVQPGPSQFWGAGVGPGQTVLQVQQHLGVFLVLSHLGRCHQHCADPLRQTLHFSGECRGLCDAEMSKQTQTWSRVEVQLEDCVLRQWR